MTVKNLDFSYSKMSMYSECPLKYKFRYIDKLPEKPKYYFAFGHSVHSALEFLYNVKSPPFPPLEEILESFERDWRGSSWEEKGYPGRQQAERDYAEGRRMLAAYHKKHYAGMAVPLMVEYKTNVKIDGLSVMSVVDRIDYLGDGRISIVDYKTGKDVKRDPGQLHMYQKICELDPVLKEMIAAQYGYKDADVLVENLIFYHVPSLKENIFGRSPQDELEVFWNKALSVADNIKSGRFEPAPGERQCKFCDYHRYCPVFSGAGGAAPCRAKKSSAPETQPDLSPEELLSELADRYGGLKNSAHDAEIQMEDIKKQITGIMQEKGYRRHFGRKFSVEIKTEEKYAFRDRNAVISALKELGLYEKTLAPTQAGIQKLLSDPDIPQEHKQRLKELADRSEHTALLCKKIEEEGI